MSYSQIQENAALLCLLRQLPNKSSEIGNRSEELRSAVRVVKGEVDILSDLYAEPLQLPETVQQADLDAAIETIEKWKGDGIRFVSVLDPDYPQNLREVFDRPAAIYMRGQLLPQDMQAVSIVGTRQASDMGRRRAAKLAKGLVARGVTVFSGLAAGIDTAAHTATLRAGGRTVAVIGTGLNRYFPKENRELQQEIAQNFCLISQFDPNFGGARYSFPMRNKVMSGLSLATVVIEAGDTSGAKIQAQYALKHGRSVFLLKSLVEQQPWAQKMMKIHNVHCLEDEDQILSELGPLLKPSSNSRKEFSFG